MSTGAPEWAGPARFRTPDEPTVRADGARQFNGLVEMSVQHLAQGLR